MDTEAIEAQVKAEQAELDAAKAQAVPVVQLQPKGSGSKGRCNWCGRFSENLVVCEVVNGVERWKGIECCGARHA
jgi:hypothetical protein